MIKLIDITKEYKNGVKALNNINIHIEKGEFVFLVGSSGAGKTTLIKMLLKELQPSNGQIMINNKDITNLKSRKIPQLRRNIGVVFQDFRLLQNKTVYENIAFVMEILGYSSKEIRRKVPLALSMVGLSSRAHSYPDQLSGGEQQRAALARAIINKPNILIADEPTGNLDPDTAWEIMNIIKDINGRGTTVVMATHDKEIVNTLKKRVIALKDGQVVRDEVRGEYDHAI